MGVPKPLDGHSLCWEYFLAVAVGYLVFSAFTYLE